MSRSLLAAVAILLVACSLRTARADDDLSCLERTTQQVVQWDREWQGDKRDHGVRYRVMSLQEYHPKEGPKGYQLKLQALGAAREPLRVATITKDLAARLFCERVEWGDYRDRNLSTAVVPKKSAVPLGEVEEMYPVKDALATDFPYRRLVEGRWVPARPSHAEIPTICPTGSVTYSCSPADAERVRDELTRAGRPYKFPRKVMLPNDFLKHTERGWARADPIDLGIDATMAVCNVAGRDFTCLSSEKRRYSSELKEVDRLAELEQRVFPPPSPTPKPGAAERRKKKR